MTHTRAAWKIALALLALTTPTPSQACNLPSELSRVVIKVLSADTLLLDDGSEVVLIGAMPPVSLDQSASSQQAFPPAEVTRKHLEALVGGKAIDLAFSGRRLDRYGRHLAHVFLNDPVIVRQTQSRHWVQGGLIAGGLARAYTLPGNTACIDDLLMQENHARTNQSGNWGSGVFQDRNAHDPRELARFRDTFQTLEGRIDHAAKVRGHQVFDFTPSGRTGFSIWIAPPPNTRPSGTRRRSSATSPDSLAGKRVRVRGWIEQRRGPRLTLDDLSQIEILDDAQQTSTPEPDGASASARPVPIPAAHQ
jgi:micrococcal nuclease